MTKKALLFLFLALVVVAPLPFGGNNQIAWAVYGVSAAVLVLAYSLHGLVSGEGPAVASGKILLPLLLYVLVGSWIFIQAWNVTPDSLHHPVWRAAGGILGTELNGAISVNPYETLTGLMRLLTYGCVFWLALQFGRDRQSADLILNVVALGVALYASYGLVLWAIGSNTILWYDKGELANLDRLSSTFISGNNFATYCGLGCIAFLGLFLRSMREGVQTHGDNSFKIRLERVLSTFAGNGSLYFLGLLITLGALLLSNSRAGFIFTLVGMGTLVLISFLRRREEQRTASGRFGLARLAVVGLLAVGTFVVFFDLGGERLSQRFEDRQLADVGRWSVFQRVIDVIGENPVLGTGFDSFSEVFPTYIDKSIPSSARWDKAHNTYLENVMELGLPAALALFLSVGLCVAMCLYGALTRKRSSHIPLIAFSGSVLVILHSAVDFSLQIAGVTITYAALLGLGYAQSWSSRKT